MIPKFTRRNVIAAAAATGTAILIGNKLSAPAASGAAAGADEAVLGLQRPGEPGRDYMPVITPNGTTLPFRIVDGVKVMHLIAGTVEHEFAPGLRVHCWGYNGRTPGPTIEAVAGDRLRIYVTNRLPEPTTVHWHGVRVPNGMDGVAGLTQEPIASGQTFRYEFVVPEAGTFMYHPHFDEMTQQALGMMGMFIVHPRRDERGNAATAPGSAGAVDRDYAMMLSEWRIDPGASRPNPLAMTDFNVLTINSKCYPATEPLLAQTGQRVRLRFGNLSAMDHHPIHLHGYQMTLTETDGGILPQSARFIGNTLLVPAGATRAIEFAADAPGDWAMHCHMTHHAMNQMGHAAPMMLGVASGPWEDKVKAAAQGVMLMGQSGMGDMNDMTMPVPENSIPMLGGKGPFGAIDMGGMFTILKVRDRITRNDDPGNYAFPAGTVARAATDEELKHDGIDAGA